VDSSEIKRKEAVAFVAGQSALGCLAYSYLSSGAVGDLTGNGGAAACACMTTPLACMTASALYGMKVGVKPHGALASFTGGIDGVYWGYLLYSAMAVNTESLPIGSSLFVLSSSLLLNASWLAYSQMANASEGSYVSKTLFSFQSAYYYYQLKRMIYGSYMRMDTTGEILFDDFKTDMTVLPAVAIGSGMAGWFATRNLKNYTAGDALFLSANISKGSMVLSNLLRTAYMQTFWSSDKWSDPYERLKYYTTLYTGYYFDNPNLNRLGGALQLAGAAVGGYLSYKIVQKKDISLLGGLVYSMVPSLAYWAAWGPMALIGTGDPRIYGNFMPLIQIALDLGASYLVYDLLVK